MSCVGLSQASSVVRSLVTGRAELRTREGLRLRGSANPPQPVSDPSQGDFQAPLCFLLPLNIPPGSFGATLLSRQRSGEPIHDSSAPQQAGSSCQAFSRADGLNWHDPTCIEPPGSRSSPASFQPRSSQRLRLQLRGTCLYLRAPHLNLDYELSSAAACGHTRARRSDRPVSLWFNPLGKPGC